MPILSTPTKTKLASKTVRPTATRPQLRRSLRAVTRAGGTLVKPVTRRRARRRADPASEAARALATTLATYAPYVGLALDALEPRPRPKRVTPRVGAGAVLGTGAVLGGAAVYLLEPKVGREHRRQLGRLVK